MATKLEELITIDQSNLESLLELKSSFKWFLIERQEKFWELLKTNFSDNSMKVRFFHQHTIISQWNNRIIKNYYDGVRNNKGYGLVIDLFSIDDYSLKLKVELGDYLQYGVMAYKDNIMKWERALKKSPLPENIDRIKNNLLDKYNWESRDISWGWLVWKKREKTISFREDTKSMKFISDFYENGENSEAFKSLVEDISEDYKVLMDQQYK
ncbi:MAG: hypothetical protein KAT48_02675, partial [Bacteroidales bacterium]|nr:hypothetical protein [Bacteroidales bacterium]